MALTAALGFARPASAFELAGADVTVQKSADAAACPDAQALSRAVLGLWMAPARIAERLQITVQFTRTAAGFAADIHTSGAKSGTRHLETTGTSCGPLTDAVAVTLALLLDLVRVRPRAEQHVEGRDFEREPVSAAPLTVAAAVRAGGGYGVLGPAASGLISASLSATRRRFGLEAQLFWTTPRAYAYDEGFVEVGLWGGGLDACYEATSDPSRMTLRPCAGVRVGSLSGSGARFDANAHAKQAWVALAVGVHVELPLKGRWRLVAAPSLVVPAREHVFGVSGRGAAFESLPVAATLQIGQKFTIW